jgi:hypothetical protein
MVSLKRKALSLHFPMKNHLPGNTPTPPGSGFPRQMGRKFVGRGLSATSVITSYIAVASCSE